MVGANGLTSADRPTEWRALRRDPGHAAELAVLYALPQLSPHVVRWRSKQTSGRGDRPDQTARRVLRRSVHVARRGGAITGSSFYVAMLPAMAMIYCEQMAVVLRIAAIYGRDPDDPARAPEILVLQGRYPTVAAAALALRQAGTKPARQAQSEGSEGFGSALRQIPSMIGLQARRIKSLMDAIILIVEVAAFIFPVISIPVWMYANARATRRLGQAAIRYYRQDPATEPSTVDVVLFAPPTRQRRRQFIACAVPLAAAFGALAALLPIGRWGHHLQWVGLALAELALVLTFARLIRITNPPRANTARQEID
jgi:hypothetical protein